MFGFFDKRKKELQRVGDQEALAYLEEYMIMLKVSHSPDTWENFIQFFGNSFGSDDWPDVSKRYDKFMRARFGVDTLGRAHGMWVDHKCETYAETTKQADGALFFSFAG